MSELLRFHAGERRVVSSDRDGAGFCGCQRDYIVPPDEGGGDAVWPGRGAAA